MLLSSTESVRITLNWYTKLFFHLFDVAFVNAHVVYKVKTGENTSLASFELD